MFQWRHNSKIYKAEYLAWICARRRCYNPDDKDFKHYGGRGIRMDKAWLNNFDQFMLDMGQRPDGMTLERDNTDGNYGPNNCRWATVLEQRRNMRSNQWIEYGGRAMLAADWARQIGVSQGCLRGRLKSGHSMEKAIAMGIPKGFQLYDL